MVFRNKLLLNKIFSYVLCYFLTEFMDTHNILSERNKYKNQQKNRFH